MKERLTRREALGMLSVTGAALSLVRCGETPTSPSTVEAATATTTTGTSATCAVSPSETVGPYPSLTDLFRSDIREGKSGAPLTLDNQRREREQRLQSRRWRQRGNLAVRR